MEVFIPWTCFPNSSNNISGILNSVQNIVNLSSSHSFFVLDVALWNKLFTLRFSKGTNAFKALEGKVTFFLGFWHFYKTAAQSVWKKYSFIIQPLFFDLFPNSNNFFPKPPLSKVIEFLTQVFYAYIEAKEEIDLVISNHLNLTISNLKDFFDFILPLLRNYSVSLR